jgi:hypothetical protein
MRLQQQEARLVNLETIISVCRHEKEDSVNHNQLYTTQQREQTCNRHCEMVARTISKMNTLHLRVPDVLVRG